VNNPAIKHSFNNVLPLLSNELSTRKMMDVPQQTSIDEELRQDLQDSETKYRLTTEVTSDGIWSWDLNSDRIDYSPRWKSMVGYSEEEINHHPVEWLVRVHPTDIEQLKTYLAQCWQGKRKRFEVEYSLLHRDGQYRLMRCNCVAVMDGDGVVSHLIGAQSDLTQEKQIRARLNYEVAHDRLTKLPNRQLFIEKLQELSQLERHPDYSFGVLCLDLDRFKNINHNFGDGIGDRILVEIVRKLESCLRPHDILARLGGDEFGVLLTCFPGEDRPAAIASQIQQQLSTPIKIAEYSILVSISIGISTSDDNGLPENTTNELLQSLQNAEIAMFQAKAKGQACNKVFESQLHLQSLEQNRSEADLRTALEQEQFILHYQPLVQLTDRQLVGFEALIRWEHPTLGLVPPGDFIPLAEATGLITPIGWWVLRSACAQMVQWQQNSHTKSATSIFISVNITGKQFSQPYAGDIIAQILTETGLNPRCLKLEITESEIIENIALVLPTVERLKSLGVQLSMDDFGTGYSSLSYLHCLPVDTLKIDRSFIRGMESDLQQLELVKTIIKLGEVFDLDLVAEGIETETQCAELIKLQCKYGQGYLFSPPVNSAIAATLLD
jgi:diguanylate cyclase (GGDEF)-like protein/PAS domain S-box-containing protein